MGYIESIIGVVPVFKEDKFDNLVFLFRELKLKEEYNMKFPSLVGKRRITREDLKGIDDISLSYFDFRPYDDIYINVDSELVDLCDMEYNTFWIEELEGVEVQCDSFFEGLVFCRSYYNIGTAVDVQRLEELRKRLVRWISEGRLPGPMKVVLQELY